ncbi:MAG: AraC family transcriptional regulator [Verrucomicrobiae bacterium]|nr:AraC family transcriptional regulator [Verrucomicrobiae bacterium]
MKIHNVATGIDFLEGGRYLCTPAWQQRSGKAHDPHRLYWCLKGTAVVELAGRKTEIRGGRVYLIPGGPIFRNWCEKSLDLYWAHFRIRSGILEQCLSHAARVWSRPWKKGTPDFHKAEGMGSYFQTPTQICRLRLESLLLDLLAGYFEAHPQALEENPDRAGLLHSLDYMDEHFLENPSLETMAARAGLHPVYFHRKFTRLMGMSPFRYLERKRMFLARDLVRNSPDQIQAIALRAGFQDLYYFSRAYKRFFKKSPREERQNRGQTVP